VQEKDAIDSMLIALRDTLAGDTLMKVQPAKKEVAQDFSQWRPDLPLSSGMMPRKTYLSTILIFYYLP
jgi:hypothetical protein